MSKIQTKISEDIFYKCGAAAKLNSNSQFISLHEISPHAVLMKNAAGHVIFLKKNLFSF